MLHARKWVVKFISTRPCVEIVLNSNKLSYPVKMPKDSVTHQNKKCIASMRSNAANLCSNLRSIAVMVTEITHFEALKSGLFGYLRQLLAVFLFLGPN